MKRPKQKQMPRSRSTAELQELAASACYVGSSEHKVVRWWGGLPTGKQLPGNKIGRRERKITTICPLYTKEHRKIATGWVRQAIADGNCKFPQGEKRYPKKIWIEADDTIWVGLCINSELGQYKGWPSNKEERDAIFD